MRLAAFALTALLVCSSALRAQNPAPEVLAKLQELSRTGQKAFRDGKFEDANKAFLGFIKVLPQEERFEIHRARAHYYVACGFANLAKSKEALENLDKAMKFGYRDFAGSRRPRNVVSTVALAFAKTGSARTSASRVSFSSFLLAAILRSRALRRSTNTVAEAA